MFEKIADFLDSIIDDIGRFSWVRIFYWTLGITVTAAALAAALGGQAAAIILVCIVGGILAIVLAFIFVARQFIRMQMALRKLRTRTKVLHRYVTQYTNQITEHSFEIENWEEHVTVEKHGDTVIERWFTIKVGEEPLHSFFTVNLQTRDMAESERRRVHVKAHGFGDDRVIGAPYDVTDEWTAQSKQTVYIHFDSPVEPGGIVHIWVRWVWPGFYKTLIDGLEPESVEWSLSRSAKRIICHLTFNKSCGLKRDLSISPVRGSDPPGQTRMGDKSIQIEAQYLNLVKGSGVGFILDSSELRN